MSRLFVLGCSFSSYAWPTWADIIGCNYDVYENWAHPGLGNRALLERLSEIIVSKKLSKDDTVIIQWTSHLRNDWHSTIPKHNTDVGWKTSGSIFNSINHKLYNDAWIKTFWDEKSYVMHTLNYINLAQQTLENIGCQWLMTSMGDIHKLNSDYPSADDVSAEKNKKEINLWKDIPELEGYKKPVFDNFKDKWLIPVGTFAWNSDLPHYKFKKPKSINFFIDRHPSILQHKKYAEEILPKLKCSQILHKKVDKWIDNIEECYLSSHSDFTTFCNNINWTNTYRGF